MAHAKKEYSFKVELEPLEWNQALKDSRDWANVKVKPYVAYVGIGPATSLEVKFTTEADLESIYENGVQSVNSVVQMWNLLDEKGTKYPPRARAAVLAKMFEMIKSGTFPEIDFSGDEPVVNLEFSVVA